MGLPGVPSVVISNQVTARSMLLWDVAIVTGCRTILEQPVHRSGQSMMRHSMPVHLPAKD